MRKIRWGLALVTGISLAAVGIYSGFVLGRFDLLHIISIFAASAGYILRFVVRPGAVKTKIPRYTAILLFLVSALIGLYLTYISYDWASFSLDVDDTFSSVKLLALPILYLGLTFLSVMSMIELFNTYSHLLNRLFFIAAAIIAIGAGIYIYNTGFKTLLSSAESVVSLIFVLFAVIYGVVYSLQTTGEKRRGVGSPY